MLGRRRPQWRAALITLDAVAAATAFIVAGFIRFGTNFRVDWEITLDLPAVTTVAVVFPAIVLASYGFAGLYRPNLAWSAEAEVRHLGRGIVTALAVTLGVLFWFKLPQVSRIMIALTFGSLGFTSLVARSAVRISNKRRYGRDRGLRQVLIVGTSPLAADLTSRIASRVDLGMAVVNQVSSIAPANATAAGVAAVRETLRDHVVDDVVLCLTTEESARTDELIAACQEQGKAVYVGIELAGSAMAEGEWLHVDTIPLLALSRKADHQLQLVAKRGLDIFGASVGLLFLSPLVAITMAYIALIDGLPIFFSQQRGGHNGRPFSAHKFRTMVIDAENLREDLLDDNERSGPVFKLDQDPRITRSGRLLRKTSIDELPQLWNVIKGEMSLVGPRPQPVIEVEAYDFWHRRRLSMRPGITGLWQITARHDEDFNRWMELDLQYIDRWSLLLDLRILVLTPWALVRTPGQ